MKNTQNNIHKNKHSRLIKSVVILASLGLFVVGAYFLIDSRSGFSQSQVQATVVGPDQIKAGQTEQFEVVIKNTSDVAIEIGRVRVKLLKSSDSREASEALQFADDGKKEKIFEDAVVESGDEFRESISVTSIQSQEQGKIRVEYDYSPQDRSLLFESNISHNLIIGSLEAEVDFELPELAFVGEQVRGTIAITPHASFEQDDLYMRLSVQGDFEIDTASPQFSDKARLRWSLSRFQSGVTQEFSFIGVSESANDVSVTLEIGKYEGLVFRTLSLSKRDIDLSHIPLLVLVEPKTQSTTVSSEEVIEFDITISNKGDTDLEDIIIDIELPPNEIIRQGSFISDYRSKVVGDKVQISYQSSDALQAILPRQEKTIEFGFQLNDFSKLSPSVEKKHPVKVEVKGSASNGSNISNSYETEIALEGTTNLLQQVLRDSSLIQGQGPIPPIAGQETRYIVVWELENDINDLSRVKIEAAIPEYVEYRGVVKPVNENIEYDSADNVIRWNVGEFAESKRTVHFAVQVTPEVSQVGKHIPIINTTIFTAYNTTTKHSLHERLPAVSTALPDDNISLFEGLVEEE